MNHSVGKIECRVKMIVEKLNKSGIDEEIMKEIEEKIRYSMDVLRSSQKIDELLHESFALGELIGKAIMAQKISEISKLIIDI